MSQDSQGSSASDDARGERDGLPARSLAPRQTLFVGITLFSMFFGAGNLILPPILGVQAGSDGLPAILGFFVTGVGLPVLGIVAVALSGTLRDLATRVHPTFARVFVALVYLAIGPCLAIPRTASTAFEMLAPLLPEGVSLELARLAFSVAFFVVAYVLALHPGRLTHLLGRVTGPALIALIAVSTWTSVGYYMIICLAGLTAVPESIIEAGEIDGATGLRKIGYLYIPMLWDSVKM